MATVRVLVDSDACPVRREVERAAERSDVEVVYFANPSQELKERPDRSVVRVEEGRDAADFALVTHSRAGDVVVTDDLGLASMVLAKGADALSSRGKRYMAKTMPVLLAQRHAAAKARRAGKRTPGPKALGPADRKRFCRVIQQLLREKLRDRRGEERS